MRNVALTLAVVVCLWTPAALSGEQPGAARNEKDPSPASRDQDDSLALRMTESAVRTPPLQQQPPASPQCLGVTLATVFRVPFCISS